MFYRPHATFGFRFLLSVSAIRSLWTCSSILCPSNLFPFTFQWMPVDISVPLKLFLSACASADSLRCVVLLFCLPDLLLAAPVDMPYVVMPSPSLLSDVLPPAFHLCILKLHSSFFLFLTHFHPLGTFTPSAALPAWAATARPQHFTTKIAANASRLRGC